MNNDSNLLGFVNYIKLNLPIIRPKKDEFEFIGYTHRVFSCINDHRIGRKGYSLDNKLKFRRTNNLDRTRIYYERIKAIPIINNFINTINNYQKDGIDCLLQIIEVLLDNPTIHSLKLAHDIEETFFKDELKGSYVLWLRGIITEDLIHVNDDWLIRPANNNDLSYEVDLNFNSFRYSIDIEETTSVIEIPFKENTTSIKTLRVRYKPLISKIINFLRIYKIGSVITTRGKLIASSSLFIDNQETDFQESYKINKEYNIDKQDTVSLNNLWQELKEILPPYEPPYDINKIKKKQLEQDFKLNKATIEGYKIENQLIYSESKFKSAWISHAIYNRHLFKCVSEEERINHLASSMENVLIENSKTDTLYKFRTKGSLIFGFIGPVKGRDIFSILGIIYDVRSAHAHGSTSADLKNIEYANQFGPVFARNILLIYYFYLKNQEDFKIGGLTSGRKESLSLLLELALFDDEYRIIVLNLVNSFRPYLL